MLVYQRVYDISFTESRHDHQCLQEDFCLQEPEGLLKSPSKHQVSPAIVTGEAGDVGCCCTQTLQQIHLGYCIPFSNEYDVI